MGKFILIAGLGLLAGFSPWHALAAVQVDQLGRQVNVPAAPQRLVTMAASLTEMVFALGLGSRVVRRRAVQRLPPRRPGIAQSRFV